MIRKATAAFAAALAMTLVIAGCGSAAPSGTAAEPETVSEGVDTAITVSYDGKLASNGGYFLAEGDVVAVITPSALPSEEQVKATVEGLKGWGYNPVEGKHVYAEERTLDDCVEDLVWALEDPEVKAIFCVRGGYGASEVLDQVELDLVKQANKPVIGYSDITVLHSAWTSAGLPSVHASMSAAFADDFPKDCFEAEQKMLRGELPTYKCAGSEYDKQGHAEGILIGGNLSTFTSVLGTVYDCTKVDQPYILFLEDVGEDVQHVHRYLAVLKHLGVLDRAMGVVFGEWVDVPADMDDYDGSSRGGEFASVADMISRQYAADLNVPVAFGFPAGHGDANYPLLMGAKATLDVSGDGYTLSWE
ncbi:MAG: LD-carboxypeptidase [Eggerthellaceae bacterium]|nr:LD-carboxypeptidase [Eggerthellaceae bacterium]